MSELIQPTPRPWHQGPYYKTDIESRHGRVAECPPLMTQQGEANAAFIVRVVNCYDKLLSASIAMMRRLQNPLLDTSIFNDVKEQLAEAIKEATKP